MMCIMERKKLHIKIFEFINADVKKIIQSLAAPGVSLRCTGGLHMFLVPFLQMCYDGFTEGEEAYADK